MKTKLNTKKIQGENMTKENKTKGTTMKEKKPIIQYKTTFPKKTRYTVKLEQKLMSLIIEDTTFLRLVNTTLLSLYKLNPKNRIIDVDFLISTLDTITNLDEMKNTIRLINSKLKFNFKPVNNVEILPPVEENKLDTEKIINILFESRYLSPDKFFKIFYSLSKLTYTSDKRVISRVNNLNDKEVLDYVLKTHKFFNFQKTSLSSLYSYGGGKKRFYIPISEHLKSVVDNKKISTFIDPFMGGLGTFYCSFNVLKQNNINVILNDINPSLYTLNKMTKGKVSHKKVLKGISNILRTLFIRFNTYQPTFEQYSSYHKSLLRVLNNIEKRGLKTNPILSSSILLFLMNNSFGGNYKMRDSGSYVSPSTDLEKTNSFLNFVGKVEFYHYLYNSVNVKFENKDYKKIIKKYSQKSDTFTTFDPPYLGTNTMSIEEFEFELKKIDRLIKKTPKTELKKIKRLKTQRGKLFESTSFSYGKYGDLFPHETLLKDLSMVKGELNYFNYKHPLVEKYSKKYGFEINYLNRKSTNGMSKSGEKIKVTQEIFMTSFKKSISKENNDVVNNFDYMDINSKNKISW